MGSTSLSLFSCPNLLDVFPNLLKELHYIFFVSFGTFSQFFYSIIAVPYFGSL